MNSSSMAKALIVKSCKGNSANTWGKMPYVDRDHTMFENFGDGFLVVSILTLLSRAKKDTL